MKKTKETREMRQRETAEKKDEERETARKETDEGERTWGKKLRDGDRNANPDRKKRSRRYFLVSRRWNEVQPEPRLGAFFSPSCVRVCTRARVRTCVSVCVWNFGCAVAGR